MTARELFDAIGAVDDDLILAADEEPFHRRRSWRPVVYRALPLAACLCLVAGAVLWQGQQIVSGGTAPETAMMQAAPNDDPTAAAAAPPEAALRSEEAAGESSDAAADKLQTANGYSAALHAASASVFPTELADLLDTGSSVYTISAGPDIPDRTRDPDWALPETVPVYASMASARTIDTEGMRHRLETMLQALGLDIALADEAVYAGLTQEEAEEQAAALREQGGSEGDELRLWADAGQLTLDVAPCESWPRGLTVIAESDGTVTARAPGTQAPASLRENAEDTAEAVLARWPEIAALAGQAPTAQTYTGTDGEWHTRFYDAADNSCRGIESGDLRSVEVALDENGSLCLVVWRNADLNAAAGEYAAIPREEADQLLAQNLFLTDVGTLDGNAVLENLDSVRLVYTNNRTGAWYLPYWSYIADEGPDETDPSLHVYREYLVPAVSLQDLEALADAR